jgi:hypothetical protein
MKVVISFTSLGPFPLGEHQNLLVDLHGYQSRHQDDLRSRQDY